MYITTKVVEPQKGVPLYLNVRPFRSGMGLKVLQIFLYKLSFSTSIPVFRSCGGT